MNRQVPPDRWRQISQLYHATLAHEGDRAAFLEDACAGDEALRREVESLLADPASAEAFLEARAVAMAEQLVSDSSSSRLTGRRIGVYQLQDLLGVGGMGEVYRARDTKLGRDVAIKVLSKTFTLDAARLARFEREARVLAALNHPHIGAIYGFEEDDGVRALVLELVDGSTLADRLAKGPIPLGESLSIARQIADALDAAQEKGIIHRDLKPANVALTPDGVVKVLDFGLAKVATEDASSRELAQSPTVTVGATDEGAILGTAAYMSPEQARGRPVDKRTDIWAFGCVLYEMLSGSAAFARDTVSDTIAAILEREPDWRALPETTPAVVHRLLRRCLEKDQRRRVRDIGDVRMELDDASVISEPPSPGHTTAPVTHSPRPYLAWVLAAALLVALGSAIPLLRRSGATPTASATVARTAIVLPTDQQLASGAGGYPLAVSPDGARLAYVAEYDGHAQLYVRELSALEPKVIAGTSGATHPFFSPDGQWVGFFADGALQKAAIGGGAPLRICSVPGVSIGASWGPGDTIVFALRGSGLYKVDAAGGALQPLAGASTGSWPEILPDGRTVLYTAGGGDPRSAIATISLDGGASRTVARMTDSSLEGPAVLGTGGEIAQVRFVPAGYLVYGQSPGIVRAVPFDLASLSLTGSPVSLVDSVERARNGGAVYFAVSRTGLLVYAASGDRHQLVWVDRSGTATPISADRGAFRIPRLSPNGKHIAVAINDETRRSDIWIYDAERGTKYRLTTEGHNLEPVWTPDGARVTFSAGRSLEELAVDGSGAREILLATEQIRARVAVGTTAYPTAWSPDGRDLLFQADELDLWVLSRGSGPLPLLVRPFNDHWGQFSRDGRWVAYASDESGRKEVYVGRFPDLVGKMAVSTDGGTYPRWSRDGRELFYRQGDAMMAVAVDTSRGIRAAKPQRLFTGQYTGAGRDASFDVAPDGRRFVMVRSDEVSTLRRLTVVQNAFEELRAGPPTK